MKAFFTALLTLGFALNAFSAEMTRNEIRKLWQDQTLNTVKVVPAMKAASDEINDLRKVLNHSLDLSLSDYSIELLKLNSDGSPVGNQLNKLIADQLLLQIQYEKARVLRELSAEQKEAKKMNDKDTVEDIKEKITAYKLYADSLIMVIQATPSILNRSRIDLVSFLSPISSANYPSAKAATKAVSASTQR